MDSIPLLVFDIRGINPVNTIPGEKIPLKDKTLNWTIPNGAPFFNEPGLLVVRNQAGGILTRDRDYYVEGEFVPFCEITGRSICTFIRVSDVTLAENEFITVDYQSIGAWFVPRNNLQEWLDEMHKGKTPIPWSKVFYVPPTLPPEYHTHNIKTEITDWYDFTYFFAQLEGIRSTRDPDFNDKLTAAVEDAYEKLYAARDTQLGILQAHDKNYNNPHEIDKFDIVMGNHDNFRTATVAEDLAGVRSDVLSTPKGVVALAKTFVPDTDKAMLSGIFPVSSFGGESFIPPVISGSFEGLGSLSDSSGICIEPSGLVMILTNHYDGRTEGLYYSILSDYNTADAKLRYTSYKYEPPSLVARGFEPNRIVTGSGNDVIMTGRNMTPDWFVALTNGSFDPGGHVYSKCDMTDVIALSPAQEPALATLLMIHHMGDYLVLVYPYVTQTLDDRYAFFRVSTSDVKQGLDVKWTKFNVTYQDYDGNTFTNQPYYKPATAVLNAQNEITKFACWTFPTPCHRAAQNGRRSLTFATPNSGNKTTWFFHLITIPTFFYDGPIGGGERAADIQAISYTLNPATGVMTKIAQSPPTVMDFGLNPAVPPADMAQKRLYPFYLALAPSVGTSAVFLHTGELITVYSISGNVFPTIVSYKKFSGFNTEESVLSGSLEKARLGDPSVSKDILHDKIAPIPSGPYPASVLYEPDGELYGTVEPGATQRAIYYRPISGEYQVREGIDNLNVPEILARPLTNNIYRTNLLHQDGAVNITGDAGALTAGGVEAGSMGLSMCGWSNFLPVSQAVPINTKLRAPAGHNTLITFPRTYKRTLVPITKEATYEGLTFFGLRQAIVDKIKTFIPTAHQGTQNWSFSIYMLNTENGNMFAGLGFGLVQLLYMDVNTAEVWSKTFVMTPTIEVPNADHPGVYLISDFSAIEQPVATRASGGVKMVSLANNGFRLNGPAYRQRPLMRIYRDGARLKVYLVGSHYVESSTTSHLKLISIFDIVLATKKIENLYAGGVDWSQGDIVMMFPKVGMTDVTLSGASPDTVNIAATTPRPYDYTGGAAALYKKTVGSTVTYYLGSSAYPETGWVLYLQDRVPVMICGSWYHMPGGTIDLRDVDSAPQNKTFYMYATIEDETPKYLLSAVQLRKSGSMLRVATITTNDKQILTITREQPFMVGDLLLSYTREGGSIPMSAGFPQDEGLFVFLHQGELLP